MRTYKVKLGDKIVIPSIDKVTVFKSTKDSTDLAIVCYVNEEMEFVNLDLFCHWLSHEGNPCITYAEVVDAIAGKTMYVTHDIMEIQEWLNNIMI